MSSVLSMRLKKLERQRPADPFARLSDEDLEAMMADVDRRIETETGMPVREYANMLADRMERKEPLPHALQECVVWEFVKATRKQEAAHVV